MKTPAQPTALASMPLLLHLRRRRQRFCRQSHDLRHLISQLERRTPQLTRSLGARGPHRPWARSASLRCKHAHFPRFAVLYRKGDDKTEEGQRCNSEGLDNLFEFRDP